MFGSDLQCLESHCSKIEIPAIIRSWHYFLKIQLGKNVDEIAYFCGINN
jgi:hypothetical protein